MLTHVCDGHPANRLWPDILQDSVKAAFRLILENAIVVEVDGTFYQMVTNLEHYSHMAGALTIVVREKLLQHYSFLVEFVPSGQKQHYLVFACLHESEAFLQREDWRKIAQTVYHQYLVKTTGRVVQPQGFPARTSASGQERPSVSPVLMVGALAEIRDVIARVAKTDVSVLITGETGVGKELVARSIHDESDRKSFPFLKRNCAAMPRELLESELFGHERGAFTGADRRHDGAFTQAKGGTILLDEIGEMHPELQAKILHVLQDGEFCPVGGKKTHVADVRIIAATNRDLAREIESNRFREDLFYRLNVVQIHVPPLRERREEIPGLVFHFMNSAAAQFGYSLPEATPDILGVLMSHSWPGNVRELENLIKRAFVFRNLAAVVQDHIKGQAPVPAAGEVKEPATVLDLKTIRKQAIDAAERQVVKATLERHRWNRVRTAKSLKISYRALLYKIKELGLKQDTADSEIKEGHVPQETQTVHTPEPVLTPAKPEPLKPGGDEKPRTRRDEVIAAFVESNWNRRKTAERLDILETSAGVYLSIYNIRPLEKAWLVERISEGISFESLRTLMGIKAAMLVKLLRYHGLSLRE